MGENLAEFVGNGFHNNRGLDLDKNADVFDDFGTEFLSNLKAAGIGAVSSFLTAELVNAIGLHGFAGQVANTAAGAVIGQVLTNVVNGAAAFNGVNLTMVGNASVDL